MAFSENVYIDAGCPDYSFKIEGSVLSSYTWLAANTVVTSLGVPNTGLEVTYDATMTPGGFFGQRLMRDQSESFFILVCLLNPPASILVFDPSIVIVDESVTTTGSITVNNYFMLPLDDLSQGISCHAFTSTVTLDGG